MRPTPSALSRPPRSTLSRLCRRIGSSSASMPLTSFVRPVPRTRMPTSRNVSSADGASSPNEALDEDRATGDDAEDTGHDRHPTTSAPSDLALEHEREGSATQPIEAHEVGERSARPLALQQQRDPQKQRQTPARDGEPRRSGDRVADATRGPAQARSSRRRSVGQRHGDATGVPSRSAVAPPA